MKPSPKRATLERQGKRKEKRRPTENGTRPAEEGEDRSAWTNLTQRKPTTTSARNGPNLTWREENARTHEIGTHGELVNDMIHPHCMQSVVIRLKGPRLSRPNPVNGLSCQPLNYVHKFQPHRENQKKETTPGKHVLIPPKCRVMLQTVELRTLLGIFEKRMLSQLQAMQREIHGKNWSHTAASCSTKRHR